MEMVDKLPGMADDKLSTLFSNAERLERAGSKSQREAATALLPAIRTELENRKTAKLAARREARPVAAKKPAAKRKARGKAAAEQPAEVE